VTYTKIFIIFGSANNLLYKFKHPAFLNKKEKENNMKLGEAQPKGPQAGPYSRRARPRPLSLSHSH
jgi:hypothetical protein